MDRELGGEECVKHDGPAIGSWLAFNNAHERARLSRSRKTVPRTVPI